MRQKITWPSTTLLHRHCEGVTGDGTQRISVYDEGPEKEAGKIGRASVLWLIVSDESLELN